MKNAILGYLKAKIVRSWTAPFQLQINSENLNCLNQDSELSGLEFRWIEGSEGSRPPTNLTINKQILQVWLRDIAYVDVKFITPLNIHDRFHFHENQHTVLRKLVYGINNKPMINFTDYSSFVSISISKLLPWINYLQMLIHAVLPTLD